MSDTPTIHVGKLAFPWAGYKTRTKGINTIRDEYHSCPLCKPWANPIKAESIGKHLEAHDRRAERSRDTAAAREMGMSKPIVGQLGLLGDVAEVVPKPKKQRKGKS